ncbi:hypothetical protein ACRARH_25095 [Phytobacter ursingii]
MKIYWSHKDIPELAGLPASVGHKNYKEALSLANRHVVTWLGGVVYVVLAMGLTVVFDRILPGKGHFAHSFLATIFALLPVGFIWNQVMIYVIRKYYTPVLARRSAACGEVEKTAERLVDEADEREYQQWRVLRRYGHVALCILILAAICSLATSA